MLTDMSMAENFRGAYVVFPVFHLFQDPFPLWCLSASPDSMLSIERRTREYSSGTPVKRREGGVWMQDTECSCPRPLYLVRTAFHMVSCAVVRSHVRRSLDLSKYFDRVGISLPRQVLHTVEKFRRGGEGIY